VLSAIEAKQKLPTHTELHRLNAQPAERIVAVTAAEWMHGSIVRKLHELDFGPTSHQQVVVGNWIVDEDGVAALSDANATASCSQTTLVAASFGSIDSTVVPFWAHFLVVDLGARSPAVA
jgi:hypothetical protein